MEKIDIVKAYFHALDAADFNLAETYLDESFQLVDFTQYPMDKAAVLEMMQTMKNAMSNLAHSLSNIRVENNMVKMTIQLSGTSSKNLDLRKMGIGVIPPSNRFIIFPNGNYEFAFREEKISLQRDVSAPSPNRRMSGMLKALGVNVAALRTTI